MLRLLLVLLAWSHVSLAAHQFEHSLEDSGESCSVCLLLERHDDLAPADDAMSAPTASPVVAVPAQREFRSLAYALYLSRASP